MTIRFAGARLLSFSLIFIILSILFAGEGMIAFGLQMVEFRDFMSSLVTTVIVSATGSEDIYKKQYLINPLIASVWHWSLICVMYVVCLNLILCILVDAYTGTVAARSKSDGPVPTLWEQSVDTAKHLLLTLIAACKQVPNESVKYAVFSARRASIAKVPVAPEESLPPVDPGPTPRVASLFQKRPLRSNPPLVDANDGDEHCKKIGRTELETEDLSGSLDRTI
jgi:hypothetical protein